VFNIKRDSENHVQYLFFAHKKQIKLLLTNPDILFIDYIYRTNKYRLPLIHILGYTSLGKFFSIGFCFIRNETYQDYYWAVSTFLARTGAPQPRVFLSD
jgi:MULE transposase domain